METVEIVGIVASVIVLISFLMRDILVIRSISIIASIVFVVYGIMLGALSIWLLNGILIFVHIFFLLRSASKASKKKKPITEKRTPRLQNFRREHFAKKSLRELTWFVESDLG